MDNRNFLAGALGSPPPVLASPSVGYPTDGNEQTGTPATSPGARFFYEFSEEIRNVLIAAGITPDSADLTQLQQAIIKLVGQQNHVVRLEGVTFNAGVADGEAVYWDEGNNRYDKALADGTAKQNVIGFADVTNGLVESFGRSALFSGLTPGAKYYLSDSVAGAITTSAPAEKVPIGLAKSATTMLVDIDPETALSIQTQATWDTGTDTTESVISPAKLETKLQDSILGGSAQSWQDVLGSRVAGVVYTNTTGRTIFLALVRESATLGRTLGVNISGILFSGSNSGGSAGNSAYAFFPIPDGDTYEVVAGLTPTTWMELR